mmetsp:Transcript_22026/g.50327  ORF Transcript_22026/g.50327 Transcript_22026/m.50327 type:complete len:185 (+) Transcript_22026:81-635(+)
MSAGTMEEELTPTEEVQKVGKAVMMVGIVMSILTLSMAVIHAIFYQITGHGCNTDLATTYLMLAACNAVIGIIVAVGVAGTKQMFTAVQNATPTEKQELAGQVGSVKPPPTGVSSFRGLVRTALCVQSLFSFTCIFILMHGVFQAYASKLSLCKEIPVVSYWLFAPMNFLLLVVNAFVYRCVDV